MAIQTAIDSINNSSGSPFGFKNRIINGAMVIDQRNAGASVTPAASTYLLDRWQCINTQGSKFSYQQSSTTASGFKNSMLATVVSAFSVGSGDFFLFTQQIEGFNIADLGWGAAGAATVTLSFWVRSSLTGTFGGYVTNGNNTRSYPFAYTISAANTFEYKTVTIAGDTTGTWNTGNTSGIQVGFSLGSGSSVNGTAGAWATATYLGATGQTNIVGTNGATFYITGVQLEKGSVATAFDYRPYGTELQLCQRYYETAFEGLAAATNVMLGTYSPSPGGSAGSVWFKQTKRAIPTVSAGAGSTAADQISQNHYSIFGGINTYARLYTPVTFSAEL